MRTMVGRFMKIERVCCTAPDPAAKLCICSELCGKPQLTEKGEGYG